MCECGLQWAHSTRSTDHLYPGDTLCCVRVVGVSSGIGGWSSTRGPVGFRCKVRKVYIHRVQMHRVHAAGLLGDAMFAGETRLCWQNQFAALLVCLQAHISLPPSPHPPAPGLPLQALPTAVLSALKLYVLLECLLLQSKSWQYWAVPPQQCTLSGRAAWPPRVLPAHEAGSLSEGHFWPSLKEPLTSNVPSLAEAIEARRVSVRNTSFML